MESATKIYLAGTTKVVCRGRRPIILLRKGAAFLAYLAIQGRVHRSKVAGLLWPSVDGRAAGVNLRELLSLLHAMVGTSRVVVSSGEFLHLDPSTWVDILHDPDGVDGRKLLLGHTYDDCPALAAWLASERDGLRGTQTSRLLEELSLCFK